MPVDKFDH